MSEHSHDGGAHDDGQVGHLVPIRLLVVAGAGLLILTWITVLSAGIDLGEMNIYIALAIAVLKATIVGLFFMHLRWDRPFNGIVFVAAVVFVGLFLALAITDSAEYQPDITWEDGPGVVTAIGEDTARLAADAAADVAGGETDH